MCVLDRAAFVGGLLTLDATNVFDAQRDTLIGATGSDWFFAAASDLLSGKKANEQVN